jgi:hypothetical protein
MAQMRSVLPATLAEAPQAVYRDRAISAHYVYRPQEQGALGESQQAITQMLSG